MDYRRRKYLGYIEQDNHRKVKERIKTSDDDEANNRAYLLADELEVLAVSCFKFHKSQSNRE